jgi:hypothetical protein
MPSCFSTEIPTKVCLICLEETPDTIPPCRGVLFPLFHRKCLDMANHGKSTFKCPHCNQPYSSPEINHAATKRHDDVVSTKLDTLNHKVQGIMDKWLQNRSYWVKGPEYIPVEKSLMNPTEVNLILGSICNTVYQQLAELSLVTAIYCFHPPPPDEDAIVYRHRDAENGIETDVILRRTAILNNNNNAMYQGSFQMDGFTICMSRSRYSRRCFRTALSFLEKRDFSVVPIDS